MRRGAINDAAAELGCNKLALGHNYDDVVETVLLNLFYEGRFGSFLPVTYLDRSKITVIRPLIYAPEREVAAFSKSYPLPVVKSVCPANGNTQRESMKNLLYELSEKNRSLCKNIFGALERAPMSGWEIHSREERIKSQNNTSECQ
jgi:tRNA(Ile)-lysidine synthase TilS/MesJ